MSPSFQLVIRTGPDSGKVYPIEKSELFIGRDLNNEIVINDQEVSRRHARVFVQGGNYVIEDLGSTNGTSVNGQRIMGPYILRSGELITFGENVNLLFQSFGVESDATVASSGKVQSATAKPTPPPSQFASSKPVIPDIEEDKKKFPIWLIIIIAVILLCICAFAVGIYFIDANYMWCDVFPFLFGPELCP